MEQLRIQDSNKAAREWRLFFWTANPNWLRKQFAENGWTPRYFEAITFLSSNYKLENSIDSCSKLTTTVNSERAFSFDNHTFIYSSSIHVAISRVLLSKRSVWGNPRSPNASVIFRGAPNIFWKLPLGHGVPPITFKPRHQFRHFFRVFLRQIRRFARVVSNVIQLQLLRVLVARRAVRVYSWSRRRDPVPGFLYPDKKFPLPVTNGCAMTQFRALVHKTIIYLFSRTFPGEF